MSTPPDGRLLALLRVEACSGQPSSMDEASGLPFSLFCPAGLLITLALALQGSLAVLSASLEPAEGDIEPAEGIWGGMRGSGESLSTTKHH